MGTNIYFVSNLEDSTECPVCYEDFKMGTCIRILPCNHYFCNNCITEWTKKQNICPICRNNNNYLPENIIYDEKLEKIKNDYYKHANTTNNLPVSSQPIQRSIRIYLDFNYDYSRHSVFKLFAKDVPNNQNYDYGWARIDDINRRYLTIEYFDNLSCITMYIKNGTLVYRFHVKFELVKTQLYDTSIHVKFKRDNFSLIAHTDAEIIPNNSQPFAWSLPTCYSKEFDTLCFYCQRETGYLLEYSNCSTKLVFRCEHNIPDVLCCNIL